MRFEAPVACGRPSPGWQRGLWPALARLAASATRLITGCGVVAGAVCVGRPGRPRDADALLRRRAGDEIRRQVR